MGNEIKIGNKNSVQEERHKKKQKKKHGIH